MRFVALNRIEELPSEKTTGKKGVNSQSCNLESVQTNLNANWQVNINRPAMLLFTWYYGRINSTNNSSLEGHSPRRILLWEHVIHNLLLQLFIIIVVANFS